MWGREEDRRAKSKNQASDERAREAEDELLLDGSARAEPGDQHGRDGGRDARPRDGLIDDVAECGAQAELEREGNGLGLPEGTRNEQRNFARGQRHKLLVGCHRGRQWHREDGVQHTIDAVEQRGVGPDGTLLCHFQLAARGG